MINKEFFVVVALALTLAGCDQPSLVSPTATLEPYCETVTGPPAPPEVGEGTPPGDGSRLVAEPQPGATVCIPAVDFAHYEAATADPWQTYRNTQAGYTVDYPATWTVNEYYEAATDSSITTFAPTDNIVGISVSVQHRQLSPTEIANFPNMPNTSCQQVLIGGLTGWSCFTTMGNCAFGAPDDQPCGTTTLVGQGKLYHINNEYIKEVTDPRVPRVVAAPIYRRFLDSFTPLP